MVYLICFLPVDQACPEQIAAWTRGHWDIANRLHWIRDMVTGEDRHQLRTRNGPLISAALRNLATRPHPPRPRTPHTHRRHHQSHGQTSPTSHQTIAGIKRNPRLVLRFEFGVVAVGRVWFRLDFGCRSPV